MGRVLSCRLSFVCPLVMAVLLVARCGGAQGTPDMGPDSVPQEADLQAVSDDAADTCDVPQAGTDVAAEAETSAPLLSIYECLRSIECKRVMVAAHRGLHIAWPENSLAAIRAAGEAGIALAEVDVRHTADNVLVLMHDDTVDRTTDGTGEVSSLTWAEIQQLQLGKSDPSNPESTQVPTFEAALQLAMETGLVLYVDQKTDRWELVQALVQKGGYYAAAMIRDSPATIEKMVAKDPELLVMPAIDNVLLLQGVRPTIPDLHIVELANSIANPDFVEFAHAAAIKVQQDVMVCDLLAIVDDYSCWQEFIASGVDMLQSDFPHVLGPLVEEYNLTGVFPAAPPAR